MTGPLPRGCRMLRLERTTRHGCSVIPPVRSSTGDPACFSRRQNPTLAYARTGLVAARPRLEFRPVRSTPQLTYRTRFRVHFGARKRLRIRGKQPRYLCLVRQSECSFWNPVREFGGTENHPAPNDPKLGRLRCARQGLVRVPESNTKYGGKGGKTGVGAAPVIWPSISESKRIRQGKNLTPTL